MQTLRESPTGKNVRCLLLDYPRRRTLRLALLLDTRVAGPCARRSCLTTRVAGRCARRSCLTTRVAGRRCATTCTASGSATTCTASGCATTCTSAASSATTAAAATLCHRERAATGDECRGKNCRERFHCRSSFGCFQSSIASRTQWGAAAGDPLCDGGLRKRPQASFDRLVFAVDAPSSSAGRRACWAWGDENRSGVGMAIRFLTDGTNAASASKA